MAREAAAPGLSILVVEDDQASGEGYAALFGGKGYAVHWAKNGYEALASVSREPPSLILLDLKVPKVDGWELLDRLKGNPAASPIPIIVVTGDSLATHHELAKSRGAMAVLTKPIDPAELLDIVRKTLTIEGV